MFNAFIGRTPWGSKLKGPVSRWWLGALVLVVVGLAIIVSAVTARAQVSPPISPPPGVATETPTVTPTPTCVATVDIMLVLDGSGSIAPSDFVLMQDFATSLVTNFDVSATAARVGVVQFSSEGTGLVEIGLSDSAAAIIAAVAGMSQIGGSTDIQEGIALGQGQLASAGRAGVPHVLIVLTDGEHNEAGDPLAEANAARAAGSEVFAIGVGPGPNITELNNIASDPDSTHVFTAPDFAALASILNGIAGQVCVAHAAVTATPTIAALPPTGASGGSDGGSVPVWLLIFLTGAGAAAAAGYGALRWRRRQA